MWNKNWNIYGKDPDFFYKKNNPDEIIDTLEYLRKTENTFSLQTGSKKYGKFKKARKYNPAGYEGIFNTTVFDQKGLKVDLLKYLDDNYTEWNEWNEIVNEKLEQHLENYYPEDQRYMFQFGFGGGDDRDGTIYFFSKEPLYLPEPMEFKLYGKKYLMTWENELILDDLIEVEPIEPSWLR